MKKGHNVWILYTPKCYAALKEEVGNEKRYSTLTKHMMWIIQNYKPETVLEDYTFQTSSCLKAVISLNDKEYNAISAAAEEEGVVPGRYIRNLIYTYFRHQGCVA